MQDWYYADHRDLLKWSVLVLLAQQHRLSRIIQIAYLRPSIFPTIDMGGQETELPSEVRAHFRNINNIAGLHNDIYISVFDRVFDDRKTYQEAAIGYLAHSLDQDCFAIVGAVNGMRSRFPVAIEFYRNQVLTVKDSVIMLRTQDDMEGL